MENSENGTFEEKRRFPRLKGLWLLSYVSKEGGVQQTPVSMGRVLDISPVGVRVEVYEEVEKGTEMELNIAVGETALSLKGSVVHVGPAEDTKRVLGIDFCDTIEELVGLGLK